MTTTHRVSGAKRLSSFPLGVRQGAAQVPPSLASPPHLPPPPTNHALYPELLSL